MSTLASRAAVVAAVAASLTGLVAAPAHAAAPLLSPVAGTATDGAYSVMASCHSGPSVPANHDQVTYAIYGQATGYSTTPHRVVATGITCSAVDAVTGQEYGSTSTTLPGSAAVTAGTVAVTYDGDPKLCVEAWVLFDNGISVSYRYC